VEWLSGLRLEALPPQAIRLLKTTLLDHFGCAIGALGTGTGRSALRYARMHPAGGCAVAGLGARTGPETAALTNGLLSHTLIFDDMHRQAKLHPGVAVIPAALAAAELANADGARLLLAIAAGYEAAARVGVAIGMAGHRHRGWRATGTCGSFGAAIAAAHALGTTPQAMHDAFALAAAQASGNFAFSEGGGTELYLAAGTAARNGVVSAMLAHSGCHGAPDPLETADGGFFAMTSDASNPAILTEGLGSRFRLLDVCIKMYPTCHSTQTGIDAALDLRAAHGIRPEQVERVEVRAGEITRIQCGWPFEPGPPSRMIFHMGYAIGVALRDGRVLPQEFEPAAVQDPEMQRIARATQVIEDPALTAIYEERKPCDVTLFLRDGRSVRTRVDFCRGEPENPASEQQVMEKFEALTAGHLAAGAAARLADCVLSIEQQESLRPLTEALLAAK